MRLLVVSLVAAVLVAPAARAAPLGDADKGQIDSVILAGMDDAAFDGAFVCPERLADDDARTDEVERYLTWAHLRHPDWNFKKRMDVRTGLLRRHACAVTLANVSSSTLPAYPRKP